jgi:RHS repeat-associated protein
VQAPTASQSDPDRTTYAYTGTGRLSEYKKFTAGTETVHGTYSYDSVGQRKTSVVSKDGVETTTDFTYTGLTLHKLSASQTQGETSETWSITYLCDEYGKPYAGVYRDTTDANPANWPEPVVFALVTTDRGDVVELLDSSGAPFAAYRYDAWGNPLGEGNVGTGIWTQGTTAITADLATTIAGRQVLRYAGYCYDSESGMYYLSARHYDPVSRQFLSKDLSRNDGEQSAYGYCLGNPVGLVDPTGLITEEGELRLLTNYQRARHSSSRELAERSYERLLLCHAGEPPVNGKGSFAGQNSWVVMPGFNSVVDQTLVVNYEYSENLHKTGYAFAYRITGATVTYRSYGDVRFPMPYMQVTCASSPKSLADGLKAGKVTADDVTASRINEVASSRVVETVETKYNNYTKYTASVDLSGALPWFGPAGTWGGTLFARATMKTSVYDQISPDVFAALDVSPEWGIAIVTLPCAQFGNGGSIRGFGAGGGLIK